jgi:hypothetical protein
MTLKEKQDAQKLSSKSANFSEGKKGVCVRACVCADTRIACVVPVPVPRLCFKSSISQAVLTPHFLLLTRARARARACACALDCACAHARARARVCACVCAGTPLILS